MATQVDEPKDLVTAGSLEFYDKSFDKITTKASERKKKKDKKKEKKKNRLTALFFAPLSHQSLGGAPAAIMRPHVPQGPLLSLPGVRQLT